MKKYSKIRTAFSSLNKKIICRRNFGNKKEKFVKAQVFKFLKNNRTNNIVPQNIVVKLEIFCTTRNTL